MTNVPNLRIILAVCIAAILGYLGFSIWAVVHLRDATMVGDVIGTWKSFAVAAFAFWLGSSSGGKERTATPPPASAKAAADQVAGAAEDEASRIGDRP